MHHHQAESGMKGKERGVKGTGVARRHGVTETTKLVGNDKKKKVTIIIKLIGFCIEQKTVFFIFSSGDWFAARKG